MLTRTQAKEFIQALQGLPDAKVKEVYDYVAFLRNRYAENGAIDASDIWSDDDISDLIGASLVHAESIA